MAEYLTYLRGYSPVRDDAAYARLDPQFGSRLTAMLQAAPEHVRRPDLIESLYRDNEGQARAIRQVADRMGIPFTPMLLSRGIPGYAAPVGGSRHQSGMAADINWSGLPPEGRDWLRSNAGTYGLRFPLPSTDAGHLELDPDWRGELPVSGAVAERPAAPPPIMNAAMYGMGAERPRESTPNLPPIMSAARMGFRDGGRVEAALRLAAKQTDTDPSDAAKAAGNYRKGKVTIQGMEIAIENPKGSTRSGVDKGGQRWTCTLPAHYGYLLGTVGADKDHVDCYIGSAHDAGKVYVVDQIDAKTGKFDEHKVMLDFPSQQSALAAYQKAFSDGKGRDRIGAVSQMSVDEFKDWVKSGAAKKPVGKFANGGQVTMKDVALDLARRFSRKKKAHGGRVGYEEGGEVLPLGMDFTPEHVRRAELGGHRHVASSANTPLGDVFARYTGSVDAGRNVTGFENVMSDLAYHSTGIPAAEASGEAFAKGDIGRGVGNAALAVATPLSLARGPARAFMASNPVTTGLGFGGAGALAEGIADIPSAEAAPRDRRAPPPAPAPREAPPQTMTGSDRPADPGAEILATDPVLKSLREQIRAAEKIATSHPSEQVQSNRVRAAEQVKELNKQYTDRVSELTKASLPFDQAFPLLAQYRAPLGFVAPAGAAWATKAIGNSLSRARAEPWNRTVAHADRAFSRGDDATFAYNAERAGEYLAHEPTGALARAGRAAGDFTRDTALPVVAGATLGAELSLMPHQHNRVNAPPGSTARSEAETALSPDNFWRSAAPGIVLGGLGGVTGSHMLPAGRPGYRPIAESRQLQNRLAESRAPQQATASLDGVTIPALPAPAPSTALALPPPVADTGRGTRLVENIQAGRSAVADEMLAPTATPRQGRSRAPEAASNPAEPQNAPQVIIRTRDSRGIVQHRQPDGTYTSTPEPKKPVKKRKRRKDGSDDGGDEPEFRSGGFVNSALDLARRFMGGRTWAPEVRPELPEAQFTYDERASRPLNLDLPMGLREAYMPRERFPGRELPDASDPLRGVGPQPPYADGGPVESDFANSQEAWDSAVNKSMIGGGAMGLALALLSRGKYRHLQQRPVSSALKIGALGGGANEVASGLGDARTFDRMRAEEARMGVPTLSGAPYAHGGSVSNGPVAGPVKGPTGGRADALPISVKSGAYVIPSDVVSGLPGAGNNTDAGMGLLEQMFGKAAPEARAAGGAIPDVPILISHGEFVISPEQVAKVGNGSMEHGHRVLDAFVKKMRAENIKHLRSLPGPAQS